MTTAPLDLDARCPRCDRAECPLPEARRELEANSVAHARRVTEATMRAQVNHLRAVSDCALHTHDWRAEAVTSRARIRDLERRLTEACDLAETICTEVAAYEDRGNQKIIDADEAFDAIARLRPAKETP